MRSIRGLQRRVRILRRSAALVGCALLAVAAWAAQSPVAVPPAALDNPKAAGVLQTAVVAGGCFWGVQGVFEHLTGVRRVVAGYAGGAARQADYETVSSGVTGHAESVEITFDPERVSYGQILQVFFGVVHDPTQLDRQGPDTGTQYRSVIFFANEAQQRIAAAYVAQLEAAHVFGAPIVTRLDPLKGFYPAEGYHQDFLLRHPGNLYIVYNDLPKIRDFQRLLPALYQPKAVTVDVLEH